jgi:glycosyltransferase involved in cell wall biosynthesis
MRIAIDVHSVGAQASGNETYYRQLIQELGADQSDNQYTLFYMHSDALTAVGPDPRFAFIRVPTNPIARICFSLPRKLRQIKPDIFHCQYIQPPFIGVPSVVTIHDLAFEHFPEFFHPLEAIRMKTLVRWTAQRADHIVTVSEFSANDIAQCYRVPRDRISVTYPAASDRFHPRDKHECQEYLGRTYGIDAPFILYVGRLQARKNLPRLIEAYARAKQNGVTEKLVLVGKSDFHAEHIVSKVRDLGLESSVVFPGYVSHKDLPLFYNAAEVFVFPSFFEGFGLPVLESIASGLPTITSRGSSLEEVAGNAALLIDPAETNSIAAALERVLGDPELRRNLSESGLRRSAEFKAGNLGTQLLGLYRSLLDPKDSDFLVQK